MSPVRKVKADKLFYGFWHSRGTNTHMNRPKKKKNSVVRIQSNTRVLNTVGKSGRNP